MMQAATVVVVVLQVVMKGRPLTTATVTGLKNDTIPARVTTASRATTAAKRDMGTRPLTNWCRPTEAGAGWWHWAPS